MKNEKEDFYIKMLRYGKSKTESGVRLEDVVAHLKKNGHEMISDSSILMQHYFPKAFFAKYENSYPDHISFYFLRPEAYFQLLQYDDMIAARKEAKQTKILSIIAIIIALLTTLLGIFKP